jgi:hypothetical protein
MGRWRNAEGVKPEHPRRHDGVGFHEVHLSAAKR